MKIVGNVETSTPFANKTVDNYLLDLEVVATCQDLGADEVYERSNNSNWLGGIKMMIDPAPWAT
jgi:hypothetical protein|tara:strand:- start:34 stop:225 length:192 start_codon:yes stop_codon:yes gene_type:complete